MPSSPLPQFQRSSSEYTNLHVAEARGRGAVSCAHGLHRFAFAAVRCAPDSPVFGVGDRVTGFPEIRRDPGVRAVLQQAATLSALDLVADFRAELKIQAHVIDTPGPIRFHKNAVVGIGNDVVEFPCARFDGYVRHPDQRYAIPAIRPHTTIALE